MATRVWTSEERSTAFHRALAANIGNILEWYDFAVYGFLASTFGKIFFIDATAIANNQFNGNESSNMTNATSFITPSSSSSSSIISTPSGDGTLEAFAVFGGAFLMRPIGGILLGKIGDTLGRKKALEISIVLMATA